MAIEIPKIISVDDHVIEPPNVWQDRLPEKYKAVGPRIERRKIKSMTFVGGVFSYEEAGRERRRHLLRLVARRGPRVAAHAAVGRGRATRATRSR